MKKHPSLERVKETVTQEPSKESLTDFKGEILEALNEVKRLRAPFLVNPRKLQEIAQSLADEYETKVLEAVNHDQLEGVVQMSESYAAMLDMIKELLMLMRQKSENLQLERETLTKLNKRLG